MTAAATIAPFIAGLLRTLDEELAPTVPRVVDGKDGEAIHDLRVAIRRIRTLLKLSRPIYGRFHADAVRDAFTTVHRATGTLRDEEVLEETVGALDSANAPGFGSWRTRRRARERALRRAVVARLKAGDLTRARALLGALVTLPVRPDRDRKASKFARRVIDRARRRVDDRRDTKTSDVVGLHDLRIAYKELRYSAELFAGALPADLAAMAEPAARFQKRLGAVHDADMALASIRRARGLIPTTRDRVLAELTAVRAKAASKYEADMALPPSTASAPEVPATAPATSDGGTTPAPRLPTTKRRRKKAKPAKGPRARRHRPTDTPASTRR